MTSDAKIEAYIKQTAPEGISDDDLKEAVTALKTLTPEQLSYMTKSIAEPT